MDPTQTHSPGDGAPPPGPPWDLPIEETPLAFVDLEMTGLRVGEDRVIEVCIERVRGGVCEERVQQVINPAGRSGAATEHVHGLTRDELESAPTFDAIAGATCRLLKGAVLVAHGAQWDLAFLRDELGRLGLGDRAPAHAVDTLVLCRRALHLPAYGLQSVAAALSIPVARAHRAGDDVATLRAVWARVVPELAPRTARDLWEIRVGERVPRPAIVESLTEALRRGEPVEIVYRPARRGAERLLVVLSSLVPPHAIGYLLPSRGRRELRIDRILRVEPHSP